MSVNMQAILAIIVFSVISAPVYGTAMTLEQGASGACWQDSAEDDSDTGDEVDADRQRRLEKFRNSLTNTKFIGRYTITGDEKAGLPKPEEYTITSVKKLPKEDFWEITARIKYADHDVTVPLVMEVKWAASTPVITVNQLFVPGLGTFDARVLLRKNQYAGTWAHGDVGGHLFGRIEKLAK